MEGARLARHTVSKSKVDERRKTRQKLPGPNIKSTHGEILRVTAQQQQQQYAKGTEQNKTANKPSLM